MTKFWNPNCTCSGNLILISVNWIFEFSVFVKKKRRTMSEREKELKVKINISKNWDLNCTLVETVMILKFNFNKLTSQIQKKGEENKINTFINFIISSRRIFNN